jgi:hypothetical protein
MLQQIFLRSQATSPQKIQSSLALTKRDNAMARLTLDRSTSNSTTAKDCKTGRCGSCDGISDKSSRSQAHLWRMFECRRRHGRTSSTEKGRNCARQAILHHIQYNGETRSSIHRSLFQLLPRKIKILLSNDFDAVSEFLGTGASATNNMVDYSSGYFAGQVGVPRLLKLFQKHKISSKVTWFIPGHSMETFPTQTKMILESSVEIGCHGYAHEGGAPDDRNAREGSIRKVRGAIHISHRLEATRMARTALSASGTHYQGIRRTQISLRSVQPPHSQSILQKGKVDIDGKKIHP